MEAFKRQASKFREQVTKQQQAFLRQLGHFDGEAFVADDAETARLHQLRSLYSSTRAAKHFEKDIVHGVDGTISLTSKQIETDNRFVQDCCKYENENQCSTSSLAEAAMLIRASRTLVIKEKENLRGVYDVEVCKPLRALVRSAELEDGRLLIRRYERLWQDVEAQAAEVLRLKSKPSEGPKSGEKSVKLQLAEDKLDELRSKLTSLGREASSAMLSVEAQQQKMTFQRLVYMVNAERSFHRNILTILEKLHVEMIEVEQHTESSSHSAAAAMQSQSHIPETGHADLDGQKEYEMKLEDDQSHMLDTGHAILNGQKEHETKLADDQSHRRETVHADLNGQKEHEIKLENDACFVAKVIHPFDGQAEGELNLLADEIVIVHQVFPAGWAKGECNGKSGWFPSPYVQKLDTVSTGSISQTSQKQ